METKRLKSRDIVQAVLERGFDWLFQTLYDECCVEAEYFRPGQNPFKIKAIEVEQLPRPAGKKIFKNYGWKYDRSLILVAGDFPEALSEEWPKSGPKSGDRVRWDGRTYTVSLGYQFCAWLSGEQFTPAIRIFFKEITDN